MGFGRVNGMNASGKFGLIATDDGRMINAPSLPPGLQVGTRVEFDERANAAGMLTAVNVSKVPESVPGVHQPGASGAGVGFSLGFGIVTPVDEGGLFGGDDGGGVDSGDLF